MATQHSSLVKHVWKRAAAPLMLQGHQQTHLAQQQLQQLLLPPLQCNLTRCLAVC